jgi:hypothetical protein
LAAFLPLKLAMSVKSKIRKERVKRAFVDVGRKVGRLKTPMDIVLLWLKANEYLPQRLIAVEPFGMHGLWHVRDYARLCEYNEIFEIEPDYFNFLVKSYPTFSCRNEDSIKAFQERRLQREKYNFIVIDNPYGEIYGDNYCEHFDLFDAALDYLDAGAVLILNFALGSEFDADVKRRREAFYGTAVMPPREALEFYRRRIEAGTSKAVRDMVFVPRNEALGYMVFAIAND